MKLRMPVSKSRHLTIVSAYAPTLSSLRDVKDDFYDNLDHVIKTTLQRDKLALLGDFNARVGRHHSSWARVLGKHGIGKINNNCLLLLYKCAEHNLCVTNYLFRMADKYKMTWMRPRSKHWHMIDFIIVHQRDFRDVRVTRAISGDERWTDHRLVRSTMYLYIPPTHKNRLKTSCNTSRRNNISQTEEYQPALTGREVPWWLHPFRR